MIRAAISNSLRTVAFTGVFSFWTRKLASSFLPEEAEKGA
jgi:hypothetical protein